MISWISLSSSSIGPRCAITYKRSNAATMHTANLHAKERASEKKRTTRSNGLALPLLVLLLKLFDCGNEFECMFFHLFIVQKAANGKSVDTDRQKRLHRFKRDTAVNFDFNGRVFFSERLDRIKDLRLKQITGTPRLYRHKEHTVRIREIAFHRSKTGIGIHREKRSLPPCPD